MTIAPAAAPLAILHESSGDARADGRFAWAGAAEAAGDAAAAAELYLQVLERVPAWAPAWFALGRVRVAMQDRAGAASAFRQAQAHDPAGRLGAALQLAALGAAPPPHRPPDAYVAELFGRYAPHFEHHLVEGLRYRGPQLLLDTLQELDAPPRFGHAIDLGCGTGLAARAFAGRVARLTGVDLAPAMVAQARRTGLYDRLVTGELVEMLRHEPAESADLMLCADVLIYVGDLSPLFAQVQRVLNQQGLFLATAQWAAAGTWSLGTDLRYAYSRAYLEEAAAAAGLRLAHCRVASARRERGIDVPGLVIGLSKT